MGFRDTLPMRLRAAYFSVRRETQEFLEPFGLTVDQFVLLTLLAEENGLTQRELGRRAVSDPSTIRVMLVLLEGRGLIRRPRCQQDGRARRVHLTSKGRRLQEKTMPGGPKTLPSRLAGVFTPEELETVLDCMARIAQELNTNTAAED